MKKVVIRKTKHGSTAREMVRCEGYVMFRHKGAIPGVMYAREWDGLPDAEKKEPVHDRRNQAG